MIEFFCLDTYAERGVFWDKPDVHQVVPDQSDSFCPFIEQNDHIFALHSDGAGSKALVAYLLWKETGDLSGFRSVLWDAVVMNTDDLACIGSLGPFVASCTIGRNTFRIPSEVVHELIRYQTVIQQTFAAWGVELLFLGGETADLNDQIRTLSVDICLSTSFCKSHLIRTKHIRPGLKIIGLGSFGQTSYELFENSGIGSNGLTSARHDLLSQTYSTFTETIEQKAPSHLIYRGNFALSDPLPESSLSIGQALACPTRTYVPVLSHILKEHRTHIMGIIHCTGGGQTKCLRFAKGIHYVKDNLFPFAPLFMQLHATHSLYQMFSVFNCGHRMELYVPDDLQLIESILQIAKQFSLPAKVIGFTEAAPFEKNCLSILYQGQSISYVL